MKQKWKDTISKLPGIKGLLNRMETLERENLELNYQSRLLARENIDLRLKLKRQNREKIHVIFVCHRPAIWESLHSVYDVLMADDRFKVTVVAIPNKKELPGANLNHEEYASEGAEAFWESYSCLNGYDYGKKEWLDLRELKPDYVFFQQPYNITRAAGYKSEIVSRYARLLYVPYGMWIIGGEVFESTHPSDFLNDVSFYFCPHQSAYRDLKEWLDRCGNRGYTRIPVSGFPRFDQFLKPVDQTCSVWTDQGENRKFRVLWTPRWCLNEGNCTFFDYKDRILEYASEHKDTEIVFRPHPQAFSEWNATGEMSIVEQEQFLKKCKDAGITIDQSGEYIHTIRTTDCFITDPTSLMSEYFLTGKPVVYTYRKDCLTEYGQRLSQGFYFCREWEEVKATLDGLKQGQDPKKVERERLINDSDLFFFTGSSAGEYIKDVILKDAGYAE